MNDVKMQHGQNEKNIPAKPLKFNFDYDEGNITIFHCPVCLPKSSPSTIPDTVVKKYEPICKKCGQVLDWSEENV